mmetsp:Transcript_138513/g.442713  ORF Transcript_138513/g.442713 Transcript_138513/m.442713 type:complete len:233 (+) Transcript_138513:1029-1727(+)
MVTIASWPNAAAALSTSSTASSCSASCARSVSVGGRSSSKYDVGQSVSSQSKMINVSLLSAHASMCDWLTKLAGDPDQQLGLPGSFEWPPRAPEELAGAGLGVAHVGPAGIVPTRARNSERCGAWRGDCSPWASSCSSSVGAWKAKAASGRKACLRQLYSSGPAPARPWREVPEHVETGEVPSRSVCQMEDCEGREPPTLLGVTGHVCSLTRLESASHSPLKSLRSNAAVAG